MTRPAIVRSSIGAEGEPVIVIDGFAPEPDQLRRAASVARFQAAGHHYPGQRAALPETYLAAQLPVIACALGRSFGSVRRIRIIDASFSMVTSQPAYLTGGQRVPHVDGHGADRIALVHYLSTGDRDGTAFFRHRSTGFETVREERAETYQKHLDVEMDARPPAPAYIAGDTDLFERIELIDAAYNRALLYRSCLLHSGAISAGASLSPDPMAGRLTVTAFLAIE
ncbi:DUF6445 family protein [Sphingomonas rubra]|uniref:Uncharacterized protein n=1 Tax=Sphingomonas rubra TaxID=634430 RepID=A0A1I5UPV7_9SPHN|nr:DUF6445 family protein [Sphingomonas rubra]SFP97269.1 hypothetical protein SAMN04488241_11412 [Sphingomonas rubra]